MVRVEYAPMEIALRSEMNDEEFFQFCQDNKDLRIERDKDGNIIIMSPVNFTSGWQEGELFGELRSWNKRSKLGMVFNSATGFTLPNGAIRSADTAWLSKEKAFVLTPRQKKRFAPVCPEFIAEIRSESDPLKKLQQKMEEWIENGVQLAWLIDPETETSWIYRADGSIEKASGFDQSLSGENILPGFEFQLSLLRM